MKIILTKTSTGLSPADGEAEEYINKLKLGQEVTADIKKARNVRFMRKYFALLDFAFDQWTPEERTYKNQVVLKNREKFRHDIQILSGYGEPTINIKGELRLVSKSISFASMNEDDFELLYSAAIDVILANVLKNYTQEELSKVMDKLLSFM